MKTQITMLLVAGMVVALAGTAQADMLTLANADFAADADGTNPSSWTTVEPHPHVFYIWAKLAPTGYPVLAMQARSGNGYVQQSFLAGEATAGTYGSFTVTMDLGIRSNSGVTMPLRVEIWNVTDDVSLASETYTYPTSGTGFIETKAFSLSYNNGAQDAGDEIALRITNATSSNVEWETTTWLDNVTVEAVPEPATMSLLALGGLGVLARRRRRA